jgi:hypothetical protein
MYLAGETAEVKRVRVSRRIHQYSANAQVIHLAVLMI